MKNLIRGALLAAALAAAAALVSLAVLRRPYYLSVFLPAAAAVLFAAAWGAYLRADGVARRKGPAAEGRPERRGLVAVLGSSALILVLASVLLYYAFGVGASY